MENTKKAVVVFLVTVMAMCLWGCNLTLTEPEEVVDHFLKGLETKNEDALILYTENEDINMLLHSKGNQKDLDLLYDSVFKNFSYRILSSKKNKEETSATVTVEISNVDFSKVLQKYQKVAYQYMEENLYSSDLDKKKLNSKCLNIYAKQVKKAAKSKKVNTETVTINLTKNDNYSWDMQLTEEMMEIIMGGLIIPL